MVVPVGNLEVQNDNELYLQLRNTFLENLNSNGNYDDYEEVDIERIRNEDNYCKRFIRHKKGNIEEAQIMLNETLKWRKSFGVKDVTQSSIPLDFFRQKAVYPFNKDIKGNPIIMILTRHHKKAPAFAKELRRFVIYWVELMEEQTKGGHMSVIMSCVGAGISNLDLDLIKFLITLFREYYPDSLAHILIYELPWILNPAWKIIKAWLPEDFVEKIVFVNRATIHEYVTEENLPIDMGGTDATEYVPPTEEEIARNAANEQRRVHFSHNPESVASNRNNSISNGIVRSSKDKPSQVLITDDYSIIGGMLKIFPAIQLVFEPKEDATNDIVIKLQSVSEEIISYKVKTNNIESYRVKPSMGVLEPGSSIEINVVLLSGFFPQPTDKFLIMAMEVSDPKLSMAKLNTLWKSASSDVIADHKLKCTMKKDGTPTSSEEINVEKSLRNINNILSNLENKMNSLEQQQHSLRFQQTVSLLLILLLLVLFASHWVLESNIPLPPFLSRFLS